MDGRDANYGRVARSRWESTVPARCTFCAEWNAGDPEHCKWCGERFVAQALHGLPIVRDTRSLT